MFLMSVYEDFIKNKIKIIMLFFLTFDFVNIYLDLPLLESSVIWFGLSYADSL